MDDHPPAEPAHPTAGASIPAGLPEDTRGLLMALERELRRPMLEMRGEIGRILAGPPAGPAAPGRLDAARSMLDLCEDLLEMTRGCVVEADHAPARPTDDPAAPGIYPSRGKGTRS